MERSSDKDNRTLAEVAAGQMIDLIRQNRYAPGDKLPTEVELGELLGVGRNTVREAIRILVSRNIVTVRQGSGTFISEKQGVADDPFGFSMVENRRKLTRDLIQIRTILEPPDRRAGGAECHGGGSGEAWEDPCGDRGADGKEGRLFTERCGIP